MTKKPSEIISVDDLQNYYWLKSDLMKFCRNHGLSIQGLKFDLMERIKVYLSAGHRMDYEPIKKNEEKDSRNCIGKDTTVKNYNNDAETRKFFVDHIGKKFRFNAYLRQFTNPAHILPNMTYGDLITGWLLFEDGKLNKGTSHVILPQFEYNQFIKDYFQHENHATLAMAISAWKTLKSKKGPRTYEQFKKNSLY